MVCPRTERIFYDLPFSRYRHAKGRPWFCELCRCLLYFSCLYSISSSDIDFMFGRLLGLMELLHDSNFGWPLPTLWLWHTFKGKYRKSNISETYSYSDVIVRSRAAQNQNALGGSRWRTFAERVKVKTPGPIFWFSGSSMLMSWSRAYLFDRMGHTRELPQSLIYDQPWPAFATDTQLYDISKLIRISTVSYTHLTLPTILRV